MSWLREVSALETTVQEEDDDRRWDSRKKVLKRVRIRRIDNAQEEEVGTLIDLSREGLYFTARSHQYQPGMELRLIFPDAASACSCEVVRTEQLANGHLGIGARILGWQRSASFRPRSD
jgi:hypothetical protein